ncbi:MAG TPA: 50S ribosomal protein L11 methyltransferase [Dehalococcoidia bacterium]|nr:50S ribosomal protein L11 methyltransferase [Dehalococcoidia bacterium]
MLETIATSGAPGSWTEITAVVLPEGLEPLSDLLAAFTGGGVAVEPPVQALGPDEGYTLDPSAPSVLRAYAYGPVSPARRALLRRRIAGSGLRRWLSRPLRYRTLSEQDWAEAWKAHYEVEHVGRIVVRPAWIDYEAAPGEVVLSLDPGMAFGTGQHPTTRMCLLAMQELLPPEADVLDLGTGSGILAIATVALGARVCIAADIEEQAVAAARANAALNQVEDRVRVVHGSLEDLPPGEFDFVCANINAGTIVRLAPRLREKMRPGAVLLASGVIAERESEVRSALEAAGFEIRQVLSDGDWRTFVAVAPAQP